MGAGNKEHGVRSLAARSNAAERRHVHDLQLIARISDGDVAAFEELYRAYHPGMTRFVANLVRRPTMIAEVVNDTMMVVWEKGGSFNGASKLSTWMFAIAYRKAMRALRRLDEAVEDTQSDKRPALDLTPEEASTQSRSSMLLADAMASLSDDHRTVVTLTYFHEMDYREIAGVMGCPVDTVKTRMFHARRHLRRILGGELADWV
ncbi:sigma-70 family RNA polymerase sigma factor [Sphingomonas panacisoli]|uniref:Sigma-70 family RNA polymerase sigma factor n=1 Tax=Sphingomonas panacisoli TaxID=1813879 RepID=A0A5B8LM82_9SPHN|nr:sigma-70 family RNA polymerase sigma factor [Sphingomonas panacisoli]